MKVTLLLPLGLLPVWTLAAAPNPAQLLPPAEDEVDPAAEAFQLPEAGPKGAGFLGVSALPLPDFRARQLNLEQGVSLTTVMAGTPAAKAGLQVGDVVTQVEDAKIATMQDLSDAIQAHKEGDRITLKVLQNGKEVEKRVTLAARPEAAMGVPQGLLGAQIVPGMGMGVGGGLRLNFGGGAFRRFDGEGSVELRGRGEGREVVVRDRKDEIIFEGPWVTPQDKASAPPDIRERIEPIAGIFDEVPFLVPEEPLLPRIVPPIFPDEELKPPMIEEVLPGEDLPAEVTPEGDEEP